MNKEDAITLLEQLKQDNPDKADAIQLLIDRLQEDGDD